VIVLATNVTRNAMIFGGAGIDLIRGGSGSNIIVGGGGLDLLVGGSSRDLLIGGDGSDLIVGNASDDILIAGTTAYDNNPVALKAILAEWLRTDHTYAQRVNNLRDGSGTADRSNGSYFLRAEAANPGDATVFDDGNMDIMSGNAGTDWFLFNKDSGVRDLVTDRSSSEFADDIDFINQP
jgi:Ca2+-binding RTX toxin-like protein